MRTLLSAHLALAAAVAAFPAHAAGPISGPAPTTPSAQVLPRDQVALDSTLPPPTRPLLYVRPVCPGPGCPLTASEPTPNTQYKRVLYLNFDGATIKKGTDNAKENSSRILRLDSRTIPPLAKEDLKESSVGSLSLQEIKDIVTDNVRYHMTPFNVEVVTERPTSGSYHMIIFSGKDDCDTIAGTSCAGIAPLDCFDSNPNNIVWVFAGGLRVSDLATTASHEAGHALGEFHTLDTDDIMYPSVLSSIPEAFGAGTVADGEANCTGDTFQDSTQVLLDNIGPAMPDETAPVVEITQPSAGLTIAPGSMIEARIDDTQSAIAKVEFYINGSLDATVTREQRPWVDFLHSDLPRGPLEIRVVATDLAGNTAESSVEAYFDKGGSIPCTTNEQCPDDLVCNGATCVPPEAIQVGLGESCATNVDCSTGTCGSVDGTSLCTRTCDDASPCPDGFECLGDGGSGGACWPTSGDSSTAGCSAGGASAPLFGLFLMASMLGLGFRRRRG